jgi:phage I-like protein
MTGVRFDLFFLSTGRFVDASKHVGLSIQILSQRFGDDFDYSIDLARERAKLVRLQSLSLKQISAASELAATQTSLKHHAVAALRVLQAIGCGPVDDNDVKQLRQTLDSL